MKELTIEQKAQRYDKALKVAKDIRNGEATYIPNGTPVIDAIFPELKEGEDEDEKMRKGIIRNLEYLMDRAEGFVKDELKERIVWLEKQGEQNPVDNGDSNLLTVERAKEISPFMRSGFENKDKVEPKFKTGDWIITNKNHIWYVDETPETTSYLYRLINQYGKVEVAEFEVVDKKARLWTIQDAKDGDIIYSRHNTESFEWIGIFKSLDKENKRVFCYGFWHDIAKSFNVCGNEAYVLYDDFSPATKEQRDLLFQKMKEAGYEWNAEKKELKKIEQKPQSTWKPSDEQMYAIMDAIDYLGCTKKVRGYLVSLCEDLKKLMEE